MYNNTKIRIILIPELSSLQREVSEGRRGSKGCPKGGEVNKT
jgi:hypothetical protein